MTGAWNAAKVASFKNHFFDFLGSVQINSKDLGGGTVLGDHLYEGQRRFLNTVFDGLANDVHDFKCLKSRQLGLTTITRSLSLFWLGMHDGLQGALIFDNDAHKEDARREMEAMIETLSKKLKFPGVRFRNRYGLTLDNASKIQFMSAGVRSGKTSGTLGRSSGLNFIHASEMCSWDNEEGIVALLNALSDNFPNRLYIWESTARGYNSWNDMWVEAKADVTNQRTLFLGWWSKDTQIIKQGTEAFQRYGIAPPTDDELRRIKAVKEQYDWDITPEQLAWYRRKADPTAEREEDDPADGLLQQDQPFTESEAFIQTGTHFFPSDKLTPATVEALKLKPKGYRFYPGTDFTTCAIMPARTYREVGIKVWEEPEMDATYVVAADPAFGHDEKNDRSAVEVLRCYADCVEQVCEYASPSTPTHQFAWLIAALCGWYGRYNNTVQFILEINGPGEAVWNEFKSLKQLVTQGYLKERADEEGLANLFGNVRNYIYTRSDAMGAGFNFMWKMNTQLKVAIMERMRDFVVNGGLLIRSGDLLEEMKSITRDGDTIKAAGRKKDDRVIAIAMGVRAWEERVRRGLIAQKRTKQADIARRMTSPVERYKLFSQNAFEEMFRRKRIARYQANVAARHQAWRFK